MNSVNASGGSISTRIRQASFDPLNIEASMYFGKKLTSLYGREIKKATWSQIFWKGLGSYSCGGGDSIDFMINGSATSLQFMDYLLAFALEAIFPEVNLANTAAPESYKVWFRNTPVDQNLLLDTSGETLYFYLSDGSRGFPKGTVYLGTEEALLAMTGGAPVVDVPEDERVSGVIRPLVSHTPRHRASWGNHALLAAIESMSFEIGDVIYEELDRHALYNALQFRLREDVYPVAGDEAVTPNINYVVAGVGTAPQVSLGYPAEDDRYKAFTAPFSFTTSAIADRGTHGNHKSAFPVLLACGENIKVRVKVVDDLRKILVLEEELMEDLSCAPIVFVATGDEVEEAMNGGDFGYMHISGGAGFISVIVNDASFLPVNSTIAYATTQDYQVLANTIVLEDATTYSAANRLKLGDLGIKYLVSTTNFHPVTRPTEFSLENPFSTDINYRDWFSNDRFSLLLKAKALGAKVTLLEAGMMKADCRNKAYMYERYHYGCHGSYVKPGDKVCLDVSGIDGQFKYAYLFAQNEISRLQGHWFNYTNDTDYELYETYLGPRYKFEGKSAIEHSTVSIRGHKDETSNHLFQRYVDNPLFAQRAPREHGLSIFPRYSNWINSINPDGGVNARAINDIKVTVKTARSGLLNNEAHPHCNKVCSYGYNLHLIAVSWGMMLFQIDTGCDVKLPPRQAN